MLVFRTVYAPLNWALKPSPFVKQPVNVLEILTRRTYLHTKPRCRLLATLVLPIGDNQCQILAPRHRWRQQATLCVDGRVLTLVSPFVDTWCRLPESLVSPLYATLLSSNKLHYCRLIGEVSGAKLDDISVAKLATLMSTVGDIFVSFYCMSCNATRASVICWI